MSGIKRAILAEITADGKSSQSELAQAMSPQAMRGEKGRTIYSQVTKNTDKGAYLGKKGKDATK